MCDSVKIVSFEFFSKIQIFLFNLCIHVSIIPLNSRDHFLILKYIYFSFFSFILFLDFLLIHNNINDF